MHDMLEPSHADLHITTYVHTASRNARTHVCNVCPVLCSGTPSVVEESLLDELEDELELSHTLSDTRDDDDVLLEIEEMINR